MSDNDTELEAEIASFRALLDRADAIYEKAPPALKAELTKLLDLAEDSILAARGDVDAAGRAIEKGRQIAPWVGALKDVSSYVWVLGDDNLREWQAEGAPGQVWVRWDAVPRPQRRAVTSLATQWSDVLGGRKPAGRPRKSSSK